VLPMVSPAVGSIETSTAWGRTVSGVEAPSVVSAGRTETLLLATFAARVIAVALVGLETPFS